MPIPTRCGSLIHKNVKYYSIILNILQGMNGSFGIRDGHKLEKWWFIQFMVYGDLMDHQPPQICHFLQTGSEFIEMHSRSGLRGI